MATVIVFNLATQEHIPYTCTPREAVIAAYAQERKDYNTWNYEQQYGHLVETGKHTYLCGNWSAIHTPYTPEHNRRKARADQKEWEESTGRA